MQEHIAEDGALEQHRSQLKASSLRKKNGQKPQNCKVEMTRCTINLKNLCIFALRGTYFPSKFQGSAVSLVVKGSHTDLHRFDPRRPYSIKTRIYVGGHPTRPVCPADHNIAYVRIGQPLRGEALV